MYHILDIMAHFLLISDNGELYAWGRNKTSVLGLSNDVDQYFPFKVRSQCLII